MLKAIIFGAGGTGQLVYKRIAYTYNIVAFCDNNTQKQGNMLFGVPILSPNDLAKTAYDKIIIGTDMRDSVYQQLIQDLHISPEIIEDEPLELMAYTARRIALKNAKELIFAYQLIGNVAEVGVFQGEFASKINEAFSDRTLYLFDTFAGFDQRDIELEKQGISDALTGELGINTSADFVLSVMPIREKCIIKKGYFPETAVDVEDSFVFVSLDADLYLPTLEGLKFFYPRLAKGGYIFIHDYFTERFHGVKKAVAEFAQTVDFHISPLGDNCSIIVSK